MKILIGTPIHEVKDYAIQQWLANVSRLSYPADLLMVDNSPSDTYVQKIEKYCKKNRISNFEIQHIDLKPNVLADIRIEMSQEIIRQHMLSKNYDAWFSWECDQLIPNDALDKLIKFMNSSKSMMVVHNSKARWDPELTNTNMGCTLLNRQCLEKFHFLPRDKEGKINTNRSTSYNINNPSIIKNRILKKGGNYVEIFGAISPIYHLNN